MTEVETLSLVRRAVRAERAYHVGGSTDIGVKLNQNESPFDLPAEIRESALEAFARIPFNRYPTEQPDLLRAALAARENRSADSIMVGNGSNELTFTLGLGFVEAGVQVVLPRPMFALYAAMVRLHGGIVVPVAPRADLSFDVDGIVQAMRSSGAAMTVVCTPNNPTGLALSPDEIGHVANAARGILVIDEAYLEFSPHGTALPLVDRHPNVIILRTLSKAFGLAGLRLGYLIGRPALVGELLKARLPFMVDRFAEAVAMAILARPDLVAARIRDISASTAELTDALQRMPGVEVIPSATNFVLFRCGADADLVLRGLLDRGVLVRSMGGYPELAGFLRVSAGLKSENRAFLDALYRTLVEGPLRIVP